MNTDIKPKEVTKIECAL